MANLPEFDPHDPISVSVSTSTAGLSFIRSDLTNTVTLTQSAANTLTCSGGILNPVTTVTFASTVNLDMTTVTTRVARITLTGTCTINITGGNDGQLLVLELLQNGTGTYVVTTGTGWKFGTDITSYTNTTTASKRDILGLEYNSTLGGAMLIAVARGY